MGLDMYLYKKSYVKNWDHMKNENKHKVTVKMGGKNRPDIKSERITYIVEEVAYWRKFNALHGWIVKNCADGVDECQEIHLGVEEIEQLLSTLKKVSGIIKVSKKKKKNVVVGWNAEGDIMEEIDVFDCDKKIVSLLAPTEGFFFGSTDIDNYFKEDVEDSIKIFEGVMDEINKNKENGIYFDYYYQASW
jgi:hypothetical protein